jgi:hypothetical protein
MNFHQSEFCAISICFIGHKRCNHNQTRQKARRALAKSL